MKIQNKIINLYLIGLKGFFEINLNKGYFFYKKLLFFSTSLFIAKWYIHQLKPEFYKRSQNNLILPKFLYESRKDCYIYWEMSRLANNLPTTFSYYYFKDNFLFYFDKKGNLNTERNLIEREKIEQFQNPYFEEIIKNLNNNKDNEDLRIKGNKLIAYNKFINDRYDLDNYLHWKSITVGDWIRGIYFQIMTNLKFTNHYRYDHILHKSEFIYEFEKLKYILNLNNKNPDQRVYKLQWISDYYDNNKKNIFESFKDMLFYYFN